MDDYTQYGGGASAVRHLTGNLENWNSGTLENWNSGTLENWKTGNPGNFDSDPSTSMMSQLAGINWPQTITQAIVSAMVVYLAIRLLQKSPLEEWLGLA